MSNTCTIWFNFALIPPTGDLERMSGKQELSFRTIYSQERLAQVSNDKYESNHTLYWVIQPLDYKGPLLFFKSGAQLTPAVINPVIKYDPFICEYIRYTTGVAQTVSH